MQFVKESGMKFLDYDSKGAKRSDFLDFSTTESQLMTVSERLLSLLAHHIFRKTLLEYLKMFFELFCKIFIIQKSPSKITGYGVRLPNEIVFALPHVGRKPENDPKNLVFDVLLQFFSKICEQFRGIQLCKHSTTTKLGFH